MTVFVRNKPRKERKAAAPKSGREKLGGGAGIELRSILNCPQGATGLVSDRASERIGSQTNVAAPSRFRLSSGHTDYVPQGIPLK